MKKLKWIFALTFLLALQIYASPANDSLELAATLCHFSDSGLRCSCPAEAKETRSEEKRSERKVRKQDLEARAQEANSRI